MTLARSFAITVAIASIIALGSLPAWVTGNRLAPAAQAQADLQKQLQTHLQTLIDKLRGVDMPAGIVKTNGRIEATQVDIAAKYAGRLETVSVQEGDEVNAGQVIAVISSPEYEAQLRGAQAEVLKAKQALAETDAMIAERQSDLVAAKNDLVVQI